MGSRALKRGAALAALACATGCGGTFDAGALAERYPQLAELRGARLGDTTPYLLPVRGELLFFLCRWPDGAGIPVSLPPDADEGERRDIELVLRAWEEVGLGVRFALDPPGPGLELRYADVTGRQPEAPRAATAVAECAVRSAAAGDAPALDAQLVSASVLLSRTGRDAIGRAVPWSRAERVGALLHELGHALGFQGHVRRGESVMVRSTDHIMRAGRRLLDGEPLRAATLRALYAVPSGTVVRRTQVGRGRTRPADRLAVAARRAGLLGPYAQVGDRAARLLWRDARGDAYALTVWNLEEVLRQPKALALFPEPRAADLLRTP